MSNRGFQFLSLLAVIGVSIVFGVVVGGWLNAPRVVLAQPVAGGIQLAPAQSGGTMVGDFADTVEAAMPAVVRVTSSRLPDGASSGEREPDPERDLWRWFFGPDPQRSPQDQQEPRIGEGSGFIISADGYLLTNNHVVEESDRVDVALADGREFVAEVVGTDPPIDLALLKITPRDGEKLPVLPLGDSEDLRVGEWVIAIGNPLEFEHTVTVGVLSAKERSVPVGGTDMGVVSFLQTDAAINFGNSGGPLLDARGNAVGINTAIRRANFAEGIGFALPINHARNSIEQLRESGSVRRGYIGISMDPNGIDEVAREYYGLPDGNGVIIEIITEGGPAERAGLRRFDVIRKVDGSVVRDNRDLIGKISSHRPGDTVRLEVLRDGKKRMFELELGDRRKGCARPTRALAAPSPRSGSRRPRRASASPSRI